MTASQDRAARFRALADAHGTALPGKPVINFQWRPTYRDPIERHELTVEDLVAAADALDAQAPVDAIDYSGEQISRTEFLDRLGNHLALIQRTHNPRQNRIRTPQRNSRDIHLLAHDLRVLVDLMIDEGKL